MMAKLIKLLHEGGYSCILLQEDKTYTFTQRGVADLYDLLQQDTSLLHNALIADKVVGKAAAALMVLGGVSRIYADVISTPALKLLKDANIYTEFGQSVPFIENRDKTGWCPLETASYKAETVEEIYSIIQDFILRMRKQCNE